MMQNPNKSTEDQDHFEYGHHRGGRGGRGGRGRGGWGRGGREGHGGAGAFQGIMKDFISKMGDCKDDWMKKAGEFNKGNWNPE